MNEKLTQEDIVSLQQGSEKAFDKLYLFYSGKVKHFITSIIKSEEDAKELTQEIFLKIWLTRDALHIHYCPDRFMYTLARNAAFNYLKHKGIEENYRTNYRREEEYFTPEDDLYAEEIRLLIEMILCKMPEKRQKIYRLSRQQGMTNEEIAKEMQLTRKTVENNLALVLNEIRKILPLFILFYF